MTKQPLNRLYVFALADKKGREAVTEVVEDESLTRFEPDANLNGGGANFICGHHAGTQERSALHLCRRENPVVRLRIERIKQRPGNSVPLSVPLKLRLTRISACLGGPRRSLSCSAYWLAGL